MAGRRAGRELPAVPAAARQPGRVADRGPRALRRRAPVRRLPGLGPAAAAVADGRARRPDLERRLGAGLSRHVPRPADRLLLHGQRARDAGRRTHRRGRRQQRRGMGRAVALAGAAHRLRLVGRDCHPPDLDPVPGGRRRHLGDQLRPQPAPIAGAHVLGRARRLLGAAVDGGNARRPRHFAAVAPPADHSVRAGAGPGARAGDRRGRAGRALRRHPATVGVRHGQSRLRHHRGGPGAGQPDAVRGLAHREAPVLPGGRRALPPAYPDVLLTRRIADIEGGGKLLGKQGPWAMHVLATRAEPFASGSSAGYTVARAQRDVASRSNVGDPARQPHAGRPATRAR